MAVIIDFSFYKNQKRTKLNDTKKCPYEDLNEWELEDYLERPPIIEAIPLTHEERLKKMIASRNYYDLYVKYVSLQRFEKIIGNDVHIQRYEEWLADLIAISR